MCKSIKITSHIPYLFPLLLLYVRLLPRTGTGRSLPFRPKGVLIEFGWLESQRDEEGRRERVMQLAYKTYYHISLTMHHTSRCTSHLKHHTSHITHRTSHITHHTSHITHHASHLTPHTSHLTPQTSHITHHTSHITHHTSRKMCCTHLPLGLSAADVPSPASMPLSLPASFSSLSPSLPLPLPLPIGLTAFGLTGSSPAAFAIDVQNISAGRVTPRRLIHKHTLISSKAPGIRRKHSVWRPANIWGASCVSMIEKRTIGKENPTMMLYRTGPISSSYPPKAVTLAIRKPQGTTTSCLPSKNHGMPTAVDPAVQSSLRSKGEEEGRREEVRFELMSCGGAEREREREREGT